MRRGSRPADVDVGTKQGRLDAGLRRATGKLQRWGKHNAGGLRKSFAGVGRTMASVTGFAGVAGFASAARDVKQFQDRLLRLRIDGQSSAETMATFEKQVRSMSSSTGVSADELVAGAARYVELTGSMDQASASLGVFARVAATTGSDMADIASTAAALNQNLKIEPADMEQAFSMIMTQAHAGAVSTKDLSTELASVSAMFPEFGRTGLEGLAELGAALQVVKQGFGTAAEGVTGFEAMMGSFAKNAARFEKAGVKIFDVDATGTKHMRNVSDIITDISKSKLAKDPTLLIKAFGRLEGKKAYTTIADRMELFERLKQQSMGSTDLAKDYAVYEASDSAKMARTWADIKNTIAEVVTPGRIKQFASAVNSLAKLVGYLADHATVAAAAFAAWKLSAGLGGAVAGLGAGTKQAAGAAAKLQGALAAFAAGYGVGTVLDEALGLSGKIAGVETRTPVEQLRDAARIEEERKTGGWSHGWSYARGLSEQLDGLENVGIDVEGTRRQADQLENGRGMIDTAATLALVNQTRAMRAQRVQIEITVDDQGLLRAQQAKEREGARRSGK